MASLESVRLKVERAYDHLQCYNTEATRYFSDKPGEVVADCDSDPQGRVIVRFRELTPIPPKIPIILGDVIQNLRSALDYLVWELVLAANNKPTEKNQFPVCDTSDAFDDQVRRHRIDGVSGQARDAIRALQPYHYGDKRSSAPIRVLDDLCNINKHRRILLTVLTVTESRTMFASTVSGKAMQSTLSPRYHNGELAVSPIPSSPDEIMEVEGAAAFFITINEGAAKGIEIGKVMNSLYRLVNGTVIPEFEKFF